MRAVLGVLMLALAGPAAAATFKLTLLAPSDDPRLDRARVERAVPGHPTGPAEQALQVALKEAAIPLETAGARLELNVVEVADAATARSAAVAARSEMLTIPTIRDPDRCARP